MRAEIAVGPGTTKLIVRAESPQVLDVTPDRATFEIAALLADDPDVLTPIDGATNIASVGAGGASVSYFNPTGVGNGSASRFPTALIDRLLAHFLGSTGAAAAAVAAPSGQSGACTSSFSDCHDYDRSEPW